jgi:biopolymer transport protein ExbD
MAMTTGRSDGHVYSDINMTPLIDVMLVLLIIFIITIPSPTHSITINNPVAALPELAQPRVIDVAIDFDEYEVVAQTLADLQRQGLGKISFVNNDNL